MPIVTFHLTDRVNSTPDIQRLLVESSHLYAQVLGSPIERLRAFVNLHPAELVAVAGELVSETPRNAPYFEFLVLEGRPLQQRHDLMRGFTDLLVDILGAPRESVRGRAIVLDPDDWAIAGEPASVRRASEIAARAGAQGAGAREAAAQPAGAQAGGAQEAAAQPAEPRATEPKPAGARATEAKPAGARA